MFEATRAALGSVQGLVMSHAESVDSSIMHSNGGLQ